MKAIAEIEKMSHHLLDFKRINHLYKELKKPLTKEKKKKIVNGTVGFVLFVGVVAIATPFIKSQFQNKSLEEIQLINEQETVIQFLTAHNAMMNDANATLSDIYAYIQSYYQNEELRILLTEKRQQFLNYEEQLQNDNPLLMDITKNTLNKLTILVTAIETVLNDSSSIEEDMVKMNLFTEEYQKASEKEKTLLITLLNQSGIRYEILPNGQIQYEYFTKND